MTRFDEVTRLKELQAAAKPGPWLVYNDPAIRCPTCKTEADGRYMMALTDTPWLLEVAACFHPGDARCVKAILGIIRAATGPETDSDELDCLRRLQKAAEIMEDE